MLPQSWLQVVVIVVAVMPGFVYRSTLRGISGPDPEEKEVAVRLLRAVVASAVFAALYAVVAGPWIEARVPREVEAVDARLLGGLGLLLGVVVPFTAAWARYWVSTSRAWLSVLALLARLTRFRRPYDPTPTAWDHALRDRPEGWVRVLTGDGRWVGGWFGTASYASSWPEPRDLFIEVEYALTAEGAFTGEVVATQGCYVRCDDARLVDFIPDDARQEDPDGAQ